MILDKILGENDIQKLAPEELDPLALVGTEGGLEETLLRSLSRQIQRLELDEDTAGLVRYLAACLDDDGYFTIPLEELASVSVGGVVYPIHAN